MTAWDPELQPDDFALVDGQRAPGVCTLTKFTKKRKLLKIEPYGTRGARVISLGEHLAEWAFTISLATAQNWQDWAPFSKVLDRIPVGPQGKAASIVWAPFAARGVQAVMIEEVEGPLPSGDQGLWVVTISGCSWVPIPKVALSAPKEEIKPAQPTDPQYQLIETLAKRFSDRLNK